MWCQSALPFKKKLYILQLRLKVALYGAVCLTLRKRHPTPPASIHSWILLMENHLRIRKKGILLNIWTNKITNKTIFVEFLFWSLKRDDNFPVNYFELFLQSIPVIFFWFRKYQFQFHENMENPIKAFHWVDNDNNK